MSLLLPLISTWAFSVNDAQNASFSGANLVNGNEAQLSLGNITVESTPLKNNKQPDLTTDFSLPMRNVVVDLSDTTHVTIYSNGASLQMQY